MATELERKQQLVAGAAAWYNPFTRGSSLFTLSGTPNTQQGVTLEQLEQGFWQQLQRLQTTPPSAEELARVRAQVIASEVFERDSITSQATTIGQLETVGLSWRLMDQDLAALEQVTPADIQQAAKQFFKPSRMVVAYVYPQEAAQ